MGLYCYRGGPMTDDKHRFLFDQSYGFDCRTGESSNDFWTHAAPALTEDRVREIVREELEDNQVLLFDARVETIRADPLFQKILKEINCEQK